MTPKFSQDPRETLKRCQQALADGCDASFAALARALEMPSSTLKYHLKSLNIAKAKDLLAEKTPAIQPDYLESVQHYESGEISSDRLITIFAHEAKDPLALLKAHGFDADEWDLLGATSNMWHGMRPNDAGQLINLQSKIRVRPKQIRGITLADIDAFLQSYTLPRAPRKQTSPGKSGGVIAELCLADLHIGNSTADIEARAAAVVSQFIDDISDLDVLKIYIVPLGDFYHYDSIKRTTSSGTPLESSLLPSEMFETGERILIAAIDALADIAPVELIGINGNHDELLSYTLFRTLKAWYRETLGVQIDAEPAHTKHREFGKSLVLWAHGQIPAKRLQKLIYHDARESFGRTAYAEIHSGHLHSQNVEESGGVITRRLPSLTDADAWHQRSGFVGSLRASMGFIWDLERGLKRIIYVNI